MLGVAGGWRSNEGLLARGRRGERGGLDRGEASGRRLEGESMDWVTGDGFDWIGEKNEEGGWLVRR